MLWHAMPPELNTARLMAGAGPAPMLQAAAGWEALSGELENQATVLATKLAALTALWTGTSSERAIAAAAPMVSWLQTAAQQAQQRAEQATAQAASYMQALAMTPALPEIATNHITHAVLTATNFLGINMVPIGFNEVDYFVRMWNQAAGAMDIYEAETAANTIFEQLPPMKPILQPGVGEAIAADALQNISAIASEAIPGVVQTLAEAAEEATATAVGLAEPLEAQLGEFVGGVGQLSQLSGPMQQLMQPLQQLTSLASQTSGMGGGMPGDLDVLGGASGNSSQIGLLGASPLSNHPLAGGSGPSMGSGLMHAESLPGAGGSAARTSLMSQLIDKPAAGVAPAGAGAGSSSALGGGAPMGMMGAGAHSGGGAKPSLPAPAVLAQNEDDDGHPASDDVDDHDDW